MRDENIIYGSEYAGIPINASKAMPVHGEILERLRQTMLSCNGVQARTMFIRFDLHFPQYGSYPTDNSILSRFINSLLHHLRAEISRRKKNALNPILFWVREKKYNTPHHHYHAILFLDAKYAYRFMPYLLEVERYWKLAVESNEKGLVNYCTTDRWGAPQENGIVWHRSDGNMFQRCFYWGSYLAKCHTKGNAQFRVREFGCSR